MDLRFSRMVLGGLLCLQAGTAVLAQEFTEVSATDARNRVAGVPFQVSPVSFWIWSDKYVYQPGETATLKWTMKAGGDEGPYTLVAYRQNNQTGEKAFLPGNTEAATDIFGRSLQDGLRIVRLADFEKQTLAASVAIPSDLGMHTFVVEIRDYTGNRVVRAAYAKIGVVDGFEDVTGNIESNRTLVNTKAYRLRGVVFVRNNAVLTIQPGTFVIGQPGSQPPSALVVTRSGRIVASGTRSRPIIMTSSRPFGQRRAGDWGGLVLLGRAPTNWPTGSGNIEGLTATEDTAYGGTDADHDCGTLRYVRVEFAGAEFQPNQEVNAFTWGGCGKKTVAEFLHTTYGFDDAFEWFGGNMDAKYLVASYAIDDFFDFQIGYTGRLQHAVGIVNGDRSNRGIEGDNNEFDFSASPPSNPQWYNMTLLGGGAGRDETNIAGIYLRRGARGAFNNIIAANWFDYGIITADTATQDNLNAGNLTMNGVLLWNNSTTANRPNTIAGQVMPQATGCVSGTQGRCRNVLITDPMLTRAQEFSDPNLLPVIGSPVWRANWVPPPDDGFFDQWAKWVGAFGDVNWTEEWTNFIQEQDIQ